MFNKSSIQHNALFLLLLSSCLLKADHLADRKELLFNIKTIFERCIIIREIYVKKTIDDAYIHNLCEQARILNTERLREKGYTKSRIDNILAFCTGGYAIGYFKGLITELQNHHDALQQLDEQNISDPQFITKKALLTVILATIDDLTDIEKHIDQLTLKGTFGWGALLPSKQGIDEGIAAHLAQQQNNIKKQRTEALHRGLPWWKRILA